MKQLRQCGVCKTIADMEKIMRFKWIDYQPFCLCKPCLEHLIAVEKSSFETVHEKTSVKSNAVINESPYDDDTPRSSGIWDECLQGHRV